mgnify:FL=1
MPLTRAQNDQIYNHILTVTFGLGVGSPLDIALREHMLDSPNELSTLTDDIIENLEYDDTSDPDDLRLNTRLMIYYKRTLQSFTRFLLYRSSAGVNSPVTVEDWLAISGDDFLEYRRSPVGVLWLSVPLSDPMIRSAVVPSRHMPTSTTATTRVVETPLEKFNKSIKRDVTMYPTLSKDTSFDEWRRNFEATADAQDMFNVVDLEYQPQSQDEIDLLKRQEKFLYKVLADTVKTDQGRTFVREHSKDRNGRKVYEKIVEHYTKSTSAQISANDLLQYITSARIDTNWKGTTEGFILHWKNQVRKYEDIVEDEKKPHDDLKQSLLENAVHGITELRQVKANAQQLAIHDGRKLTYQEYSDLLISAAQAFDKKNHAGPLSHRQVNLHDLYGEEYNEYEAYSTNLNSDDYDIDCPISTLSANVMQRRPMPNPAAKLPVELWNQLKPQERDGWIKISPANRQAILQNIGNGAKPKPSNFNSEVNFTKFLQALQHELDSTDNVNDNSDDVEDNGDDSQLFLNAMQAKTTVEKKVSTSPTDIRRVLSKAMSAATKKKVTYNVDKHVTYSVSAHSYSAESSLIDRGANGGIAGSDVRVISLSDRHVNVQGIDNHRMNDIRIATVGGVINTNFGDVVAIFHEYAYTGKGNSIHSAAQMEHFKHDVCDKSKKVGGKQRIKTFEGHVIPLVFKNGLPRLSVRPYTDDEWNNLPHVIMTSPNEWNPSVLDSTVDDEWFDTNGEPEDTENIISEFDEFGDYRKRVFSEVRPVDTRNFVDYASYTAAAYKEEPTIVDGDEYFVAEMNQKRFGQDSSKSDGIIDVSNMSDDKVLKNIDKPEEPPDKVPRTVVKQEPDFEKWRPCFGWLSIETIKKTFAKTTQFASLPNVTILKKRYKSPYPALNIPRRDEDIATDFVYADTPAVDNGAVGAQLFVGCSTQVTTAYGCKTDKEFVNCLEDEIRRRGAPNRLISDSARAQISKKVVSILRALCIGDWQSEPKQQHQNPAERRIQTVKMRTNVVMDRTGAPDNTWLLCLLYVCYLLNYTYCENIKDVPMRKLNGSTPDISPLLRFYFWQEVYYKIDDADFPSQSREAKGHFVGFSEHVGHALTYKILTIDTNKVIHRSNVRPVNESDFNKRIETLSASDLPKNPVLKSKVDITSGEESTKPAIFNPQELVGRSFLMDVQDNGERHRATIVEVLEDHETNVKLNPTRLKFRVSVNNEQYEDMLTYAKVVDYINNDDECDVIWKFKRIISHHIPKGENQYYVKIEWETGEVTDEPLSQIARDSPAECALYAQENNLLDTPGWKRFKRMATRHKKLLRMVNQAKLSSFRHATKYMFGYEIPKNYKHALLLDKQNGNTKWQDAIQLEIIQLHDYATFKDLGRGTSVPAGFRKITVHFVFAVKHDGRHKARLVAGGHLTLVPVDSVYSGVVSLRGLRIVIFLAELNGLTLWSTDVGNAYLESETKESVCFIAGPEFGELEGHLLLIVKALYGLRSSGQRWHDRLYDALRDMGFNPSKAEADIWYKEVNGLYEYVAVYVDDLAIASRDPQAIVDLLEKRHNFKLKGTGNISYHLGMDFFRDEDKTLCMAPKKYIDKMLQNYERTFKSKPQFVTSPIEKGDNPELDTSELLDDDQTQNYQSLIGALQWAVSIGRFDIQTAVMSMSSFRAAPRIGHLKRVKRIFGYLAKMNEATIRVRTEIPDYSDLPEPHYDWSRSVYGNVTEDIPLDAPKPLGKVVRFTHFVDANLMHDVLTGKSVTGILHLANQTPIDWYSKKQATVETATYGSEFVAARICVDHAVDLRNTFRYLGVPIEDSNYMFGDNKSVVDSSTTPHAGLNKRHNILSFHRVRQAIASGVIKFYHIPGEENPADILSKHWGYSQIWHVLRPLLFWGGDTADCIDE